MVQSNFCPRWALFLIQENVNFIGLRVDPCILPEEKDTKKWPIPSDLGGSITSFPLPGLVTCSQSYLQYGSHIALSS